MTGTVAPSPSPTIKRNANNQSKDGANAEARENKEYVNTAQANTRLRPNASANDPPIKAPRAMPAKVAVPNSPSWKLLKFHTGFISGITKPIKSTSQASNI